MAKSKAKVVGLLAVLVMPLEGLRQFAYYDPPGVLTVCYGHTGDDVVPGKRYSLAECRALLTADLAEAVDTVDKCAPVLRAREGAMIAFADAVYNIGPRVACDVSASTAARLLRAGYIDEACRELPKWSKARVNGKLVELPGLKARREKEMNICLQKDTDDASL